MSFAEIHPLVVHFPVALLISGTLLEVYGRLQKEEVAEVTGWFNLRLGFVAALLAAGVGLLGLLGIEVQDKFKSFLSFHISFAFLTLFVYGTALVVYRFRRRKGLFFVYHVLIVAGLLAVLATGYCGGELVHRFGLPAPQTVE